MLIYLLRRLLLMIPTLFGITLVVFTIMAMSPGGLTGAMLVGGADLKPEQKQAKIDYYNKRYGLDDPAPLQYLRWLNNVSPIGFIYDENRENKQFSFTKGSDLGESVFFGCDPSIDKKHELLHLMTYSISSYSMTPFNTIILKLSNMYCSQVAELPR